MFINEIESINRVPLRASDTVEAGISAMQDQNSGSIAVIDFTTGRLIGEVHLSDLKKSKKNGQTIMPYLDRSPFVITSTSHVMDAAGKLMKARKQTAYLTDENDKYVGTLNVEDLLNPVINMLNINDEGTVIMLELHERDYMLGDIIRIVEVEGGRILGIGVESPEGENRRYRVSLKLNQTDVSKVVHALNRYGYIITSETPTENKDEDLHERADEFMRYLGI